jgi:superfamily II DNA or RNA helicase
MKHFADFADERQPITLQEHQQRVADKLANQRGLIAYHGLGSGKTITGINAAEKYGTNGTVVVTPAKLQDNFRKELKTYGAKGNYDIYSYEKFLRDNPDTTDKFLLIDEAHKLRNSNTARSQGLLAASRKANKTLLLSGTPIQNNASDIAPLVNIASGEDILPSGRAFTDTYTEKKTTNPNFIDRTFKGARPTTTIQPKNLEDYYNKSKQYVDYYSPEDRSNYPSVNEQRVDVDLDPNQLKLYKQTYSQLPSKVRNILNSGGQEAATEKDAQRLNTFLNLNRQASNTARKYYRAGEKQYDSKSSRILQNIAENKYQKNLIYSNYLDSGLEDVKQRLGSDPNVKYGEIRGDIKPEDQRRVLDDYNNDRLNTLLVSSAGGEGLDLKGTRSVHILEPHFNDEKINQVIGRAARYKSHANLPEKDRNVQVYKYQSKFPKNWFGQEDKRPTADQYLYNLSERKSDLNNKFLEGFKNQ